MPKWNVSFTLLGDGKIDNHQNWKGRFKDNSDKMRTGSIYDMADVLKSLTFLSKSKSLSFREKRMLDRAKALIISEVSEVMRQKALEVEEQVDRALEKCFTTKVRNINRTQARAKVAPKPPVVAAPKAPGRWAKRPSWRRPSRQSRPSRRGPGEADGGGVCQARCGCGCRGQGRRQQQAGDDHQIGEGGAADGRQSPRGCARVLGTDPAVCYAQGPDSDVRALFRVRIHRTRGLPLLPHLRRHRRLHRRHRPAGARSSRGCSAGSGCSTWPATAASGWPCC